MFQRQNWIHIIRHLVAQGYNGMEQNLKVIYFGALSQND
jgi:hypothetical protein